MGLIEVGIAGVKALLVLLMVLNLSAILLWVERKGSALIQDRIGANRANIFGVMPFNLGFINTLIADPLKLLTKEDVVPAGADKFLHFLAPFLAVFPVLVTFAAVPFGDQLVIGDTTINLQVADLDIGILYVLAMAGTRGLRGRPRRVGVEQPVGAPRRHPGLGADDLLRDRDGARADRRGHDVRHTRPAGDRAGARPPLLRRHPGLGHHLSAARLPDLPDRRHRGEQARPVRPPGRRVRAHQPATSPSTRG